METAVAVKDLALRMGTASVYKEGGIAGEDYPNHLKLTDVDEVALVLLLPYSVGTVYGSSDPQHSITQVFFFC